jgi:hypothetical protein
MEGEPRMLWATVIIAVAGLVTGTPAVAQEPGDVRHSGVIARIVADGRTIVLEEMLAWQGDDDPGIVRRFIRLGPDTSIRLVERTDEWSESRASRKAEMLDTGELWPGDFVTVILPGDMPSPAVGLEVFRPGS